MESKKKRKWWLAVVVVVVVAVLAAVGYLAKTYLELEGLLDTGDAGNLPESYQSMTDDNGVDLSQVNEKDVYTILVAVTDKGVQEKERTGENTDVLMYVRLDNKNHKMNILQIPRDTYVGDISVDCGVYHRINGAYSNGANKESPIANTATAIYELLGLKADNYAVLDVEGFRTMLNVMGGIWMNVPRDIQDKETGELLFPAGDMKVSGDTAEIILRNRATSLGDYERLELQQSFYAAVFRTFMEQYPIGDALQVAKNTAVYLNTDMSVMDLVGLYMAMKELQPEDIYIVRCSGGPINITADNGKTAALYGAEKENTARILNENFRPEGVTVSPEQLGLPDVEFNLGYNVDEGKTLGDVVTAEIKD